MIATAATFLQMTVAPCMAEETTHATPGLAHDRIAVIFTPWLVLLSLWALFCTQNLAFLDKMPLRVGATFAAVARYALAVVTGVPGLAAVATGILTILSPVIWRAAVHTKLREFQAGQWQCRIRAVGVRGNADLDAFDVSAVIHHNSLNHVGHIEGYANPRL